MGTVAVTRGGARPSVSGRCEVWPTSPHECWLVVHPGHREQSPNIFEDILADEERFVDYLETQLDLIVNLGEQLCLSQLVERPPSSAT